MSTCYTDPAAPQYTECGLPTDLDWLNTTVTDIPGRTSCPTCRASLQERTGAVLPLRTPPTPTRYSVTYGYDRAIDLSWEEAIALYRAELAKQIAEDGPLVHVWLTCGNRVIHAVCIVEGETRVDYRLPEGERTPGLLNIN